MARNGQTPHQANDTPRQRVMDQLLDAFGEARALLEAPDTVEIMINPDGRLFVETTTSGMRDSGLTQPAAKTEAIIRLAASLVGAPFGPAHPRIAATLPFSGARLQAFLPPAAVAPCMTLRLHAERLYRLSDYVEAGSLTPHHADLLRQAIAHHDNVIVSGSTGSGKTTLVNALLAEIAETHDRVVTIEDRPELRCTAKNAVALYAQPGIATLHDLVVDVMRTRPDRIVVGEVRDGSCLELLKAWLTHRGGLCTVHAASLNQVTVRLEMLVQEAVQTIPRRLIAETVDLIVHIERYGAGRRVTGMARLLGLDGDHYVLDPL